MPSANNALRSFVMHRKEGEEKEEEEKEVEEEDEL